LGSDLLAKCVAAYGDERIAKDIDTYGAFEFFRRIRNKDFDVFVMLVIHLTTTML
jgi:hypothetical protein